MGPASTEDLPEQIHEVVELVGVVCVGGGPEPFERLAGHGVQLRTPCGERARQAVGLTGGGIPPALRGEGGDGVHAGGREFRIAGRGGYVTLGRRRAEGCEFTRPIGIAQAGDRLRQRLGGGRLRWAGRHPRLTRLRSRAMLYTAPPMTSTTPARRME